jgi:hypothetical protein
MHVVQDNKIHSFLLKICHERNLLSDMLGIELAKSNSWVTCLRFQFFRHAYKYEKNTTQIISVVTKLKGLEVRI